MAQERDVLTIVTSDPRWPECCHSEPRSRDSPAGRALAQPVPASPIWACTTHRCSAQLIVRSAADEDVPSAAHCNSPEALQAGFSISRTPGILSEIRQAGHASNWLI